MCRFALKPAGLLVLAVVSLATVLAQHYRGRVQGTVLDSTNFAIPNATVTLSNVDTGVASTPPDGRARTPPLRSVLPGTYTVLVGAASFNKFVQENVPLQSRWDVTVDANQIDPRVAYQYKDEINKSVPNPFYSFGTADKFPGALRYQRNVTVTSLMRPYPQYGSLNVIGGIEGGSMRYYPFSCG